jgi:hypothetical protein
MSRRFCTLLGVALLASGCAAKTDPTDALVAADGEQAMIASSQSTSLGRVVFENVTVADPAAAAAELTVAGKLPPSSCLTRTLDALDPTTVHVTLTDCTGPLGLVRINGEETVTFSVGPLGTLHADIVGSGLTENGNPITHEATADVESAGVATRTVVWKGNLQRTSEKGEVVQHASDVQLVVDRATGCRTSDGTAATRVGVARSVSTAISKYTLCEDAAGSEGCPRGSVVHTGEPSGRTISVSYDGSAAAEVTGPSGATFDLPLSCTPLR